MNDSVSASHILVKKYAEAEQILDELKHGAKFEKLVVEYSLCTATKEKGGSLGEFERGRMLEEFEHVAFNINVGEIALVKTKVGFHIVRRDS
ncbi:MAG: peptidylprolyl isomerase [Candidatus Heimdallarchaeaceae archaeon]